MKETALRDAQLRQFNPKPHELIEAPVEREPTQQPAPSTTIPVGVVLPDKNLDQGDSTP
jgi:hypothetical protein